MAHPDCPLDLGLGNPLHTGSDSLPPSLPSPPWEGQKEIHLADAAHMLPPAPPPHRPPSPPSPHCGVVAAPTAPRLWASRPCPLPPLPPATAPYHPYRPSRPYRPAPYRPLPPLEQLLQQALPPLGLGAAGAVPLHRRGHGLRRGTAQRGRSSMQGERAQHITAPPRIGSWLVGRLARTTPGRAGHTTMAGTGCHRGKPKGRPPPARTGAIDTLCKPGPTRPHPPTLHTP